MTKSVSIFYVYWLVQRSLLIIVGAVVPLQLVWNIADVTNILMAIPNLIALILLSALVKKMKNEYFKKYTKV